MLEKAASKRPAGLGPASRCGNQLDGLCIGSPVELLPAAGSDRIEARIAEITRCGEFATRRAARGRRPRPEHIPASRRPGHSRGLTAAGNDGLVGTGEPLRAVAFPSCFPARRHQCPSGANCRPPPFADNAARRLGALVLVYDGLDRLIAMAALRPHQITRLSVLQVNLHSDPCAVP
jgi:hypothetical protein